MTSDVVDTLFDLNFATTDDRITMSASMPIAHDIIKTHDGKIDVWSKVGIGTEVIIRLPNKQHVRRFND